MGSKVFRSSVPPQDYDPKIAAIRNISMVESQLAQESLFVRQRPPAKAPANRGHFDVLSPPSRHFVALPIADPPPAMYRWHEHARQVEVTRGLHLQLRPHAGEADRAPAQIYLDNPAVAAITYHFVDFEQGAADAGVAEIVRRKPAPRFGQIGAQRVARRDKRGPKACGIGAVGFVEDRLDDFLIFRLVLQLI